nr:hypothetical protein [uncultured Allomuricauda sp.]
MAHKKKGILTSSGTLRKHLRPFRKRIFWHKERNAEKDIIQKELKGKYD